MAADIFGAVLPISVRIVVRRLEDPRTGPFRLFVVAIRIIDADVHRVLALSRGAALAVRMTAPSLKTS